MRLTRILTDTPQRNKIFLQLENRKQNSLRKLKAEKTKRKKSRRQLICQSDSETNECEENICKFVESNDEDDVVS